MNFDFGCAKPLYEGKIHPRVMFGPRDLARLRDQTRRGQGRVILRAMRDKVRPLVKLVTGSRSLKDLWSPPDASALRWNLFDLAMVGLLDEDNGAIGAARRALLALPSVLSDPRNCATHVYSMMYGCHPLAYDALHAHLTDEERRVYANWMVEVCLRPAIAAARPHFFKNAGANTPICETLPALLGLMAVRGDPGVPDLETETREMISFLSASLHAAFGPDGYPAEDIGYGTAVAAGLAHSVEALRRAGLYDVYTDCPRYARIGRAILHFVQPWGADLTNTGDHSDDMICRELLLTRLAQETRDSSLLWLLGTLDYPSCLRKDEVSPTPSFVEAPLRKGFQVPATALSLLVMRSFNKAAHPNAAAIPTQFRDRARGIVSFRSGWNADATLVVFDGSQCSPSAQGHFHSSCGHFSLSALGEYFAIDTGRYNIEQNCHNVVLIDGKSGRSTDGEWDYAKHHGLLTDYQPGNFVDFAAVDSSHQHNCYWARRSLGLVKGLGLPAYVWMVEDINKANDWAEFWWQLHASPENRIVIRRDRASVRGWRNGNWLDVHFVLPAPQSYPRPHVMRLTQDEATSSSYKYIPDPRERAKAFARPADMVHGPVFVRPRLLAKVAGYNGRFLSLMIPRRKGERPVKVTRLESVDNSLAVKIESPTVEDTLIFAYEHNLLEANGVIARGQWAVVRRSRSSGRALARALGHGEALSVGGKRIV